MPRNLLDMGMLLHRHFTEAVETPQPKAKVEEVKAEPKVEEPKAEKKTKKK